MITYNQILSRLNALANAHLQIKQFGAGDPADIPEGVAYPLMWVVYDNVALDITRKADEVSFKLIFADLLNEDKSNEREVLSDQKQILTDIVSQLQLLSFGDDWEVADRVTAEPLLESITTDSIAGWLAQITLRVDYNSDTCQVPSTYSPSDEPGCPPVTIVDTAGNVLAIVDAGGTQTISNTTVENSAGTQIATGTAQSVITLPAKNLLNTLGADIGDIVQGVDKTAPDAIIRNDLHDTLANAPAGTVTVLANNTQADTLGNLIGIVHPGRNVVAPDATVKNSDNSYSAAAQAGSTFTLSDISVVEGDGVTRTHLAAVNFSTSQRTFSINLTIKANSSLEINRQVAYSGNIKNAPTLTNVASCVIKRLRAGVVTTVYNGGAFASFTVQRDDILLVTVTASNSSLDCEVDFTGYHDVAVNSQTQPAKNGDGRYGYTLNYVDQTVSVIDANTNTVIATITLPTGTFTACIYRSAAKEGWFFANSKYAKIDCDPASGTFNTVLTSGTISTSGGTIAGCAYDFINDQIYVGSTNNILWKLNPVTLGVTNLGTAIGMAPPRCQRMRYISALRAVFVGDQSTGTFMLSTDTDLPNYSFGASALGNIIYNPDNAKLYHVGSQEIIVRNANPIKQVASISNVNARSSGVDLIRSLNKLVACSLFSNSIAVIDTSTDTNITSIAKTTPATNESGSRNILYCPFSDRVYVTAMSNGGQTTGVNKVHIFNLNTNTWQGSITVGNMDADSTHANFGHQFFFNMIR